MIPMYLYHYTSVEKLKLIIESRTILFNRLAELNDPYDGFGDVVDEKDYKKTLVYVSCWNDQEEESINLWHLYTEMKGVRIKMKVPMFTYNENDAYMLDAHSNCHIPVVTINSITVPYEYANKRSIGIDKVYGPIRIRYDMGLKDISKDVILPNGNVSLKEVGLKKIKEWSFENEWRFKINLFNEVTMREVFPFKTETSSILVPFNIRCIEEILTAPNNEKFSDIEKFLKAKSLNIPVKKSKLHFNTKKTKTLEACT